MYRETKVLGGALDFSFVPPILCYCFVVLSEEYGNVDDEICNTGRTDSSILSLATADAGQGNAIPGPNTAQKFPPSTYNGQWTRLFGFRVECPGMIYGRNGGGYMKWNPCVGVDAGMVLCRH